MTNQKPYTAVNRPPKVILDCKDKTRTRQSEAAGCDINQIVSKFEKTGILPIDGREALYEDVSHITDYRDALDRVTMAEQAFKQLPAKVRSRFHNDAAMFLDFASDPTNRNEMREMGLIEPLEEQPAPPAAPEAAPPAAPEAPPAPAEAPIT